MGDRNPPKLVWVFVLVVTAAHIYQNPAVFLEFGDQLATVHHTIIHIIHTESRNTAFI